MFVDPQTTTTSVQSSSPPMTVTENKISALSTENEEDHNHLLSNQQHHNNNHSDHDQPHSGAAATPTTTMDYELEQEFTAHLMQEVLRDTVQPFQHPNWDPTGVVHGMQDMSTTSHGQEAEFYHHHQQQQQMEMQHNFQQGFDSTTFTNQLYPQTTPDLLNLLHLPMLPNSSSISFTNPISRNSTVKDFQSNFDMFGTDSSSGLNALYDHPSLHLNLPPQTPIFRELSHSMHHTYDFTGGGSSSSFGAAMDERSEGIGGGVGGFHQLDGDHERRVHFENSVLDFRREMNNTAGLRNNNGGHDLEGRGPPNHEKQRRQQFNHKFKVLGSLLPNPSKTDRASVVGEAIEYIKELKRRVEELKFLVDKKRCARNKKLKIEQGGGEMESSSMNKKILDEQAEPSFNGATRSSWLQRKSKETKVDVRIIDDEVTIKLIQRKNANCLLSVSKILDELQLDLLHVSGGNIGDYYSFLFNTKIYEGSSTHAAAIANKLMEGVDKQNAALPPNSY